MTVDSTTPVAQPFDGQLFQLEITGEAEVIRPTSSEED